MPGATWSAPHYLPSRPPSPVGRSPQTDRDCENPNPTDPPRALLRQTHRPSTRCSQTNPMRLLALLSQSQRVVSETPRQTQSLDPPARPGSPTRTQPRRRSIALAFQHEPNHRNNSRTVEGLAAPAIAPRALPVPSNFTSESPVRTYFSSRSGRIALRPRLIQCRPSQTLPCKAVRKGPRKPEKGGKKARFPVEMGRKTTRIGEKTGPKSSFARQTIMKSEGPSAGQRQSPDQPCSLFRPSLGSNPSSGMAG